MKHTSSLRATVIGAVMLAIAGCGGGSSPTTSGGTTGTSSSTSEAATTSGGGDGGSAAVPRDCSTLKTRAVSELLGGVPILDSDSEFNTTIEVLHCVWYTSDAVPEKVSVQLGVADDFLAFYASQEGTGISTFTKVDGFDEGRLYGEELLIAKRNGFAVVVDVRTVFPTSSQEQIVAVALEATTT